MHASVNSRRSLTPSVGQRVGTTFTELIVASVVLIAVASLVGRSVLTSGRLWKINRQHVVASDEVANQLQRLISLDADQLASAIAEIQPSAFAAGALPDAKISATLSASSSPDTRLLVLSLDWKRPGDARPVQLTGWIPSNSSDPQSSGEKP